MGQEGGGDTGRGAVPARTARYHAFGLTIETDLPLDLPEEAREPDVRVRYGRLPQVGPPLHPEWGSAFAGGDARALAVRVPDRFAAEVREGREIVLDPAPDVAPEYLAAFVARPLLGLILLQRGYLLLHAACVAIEGRAVAVAGASGQGKSTTAAALLARGHTLLCDDIVPLTDDFRVIPGDAYLNLSPASLAAVPHQSEAVTRAGIDTDKRLYRATRPARLHPLPLQSLYILNDGPLGLEPLGSVAALPELVRHSYGITAIQYASRQAAHFHRLTALLHAIPVQRLNRPRDLAALDALARTIEADVSRQVGS